MLYKTSTSCSVISPYAYKTYGSHASVNAVMAPLNLWDQELGGSGDYLEDQVTTWRISRQRALAIQKSKVQGTPPSREVLWLFLTSNNLLPPQPCGLAQCLHITSFSSRKEFKVHVATRGPPRLAQRRGELEPRSL